MKTRAATTQAKPKKLKIVIGDVNLMACRLLSEALEKQPDFRVVASAVDVPEVLSAIQRTNPDILLVSAYLQGGAPARVGGMEEIHRQYPDLPMMGVLDRAEPLAVIEAFRAGAKGIFARSQSEVTVLSKCIRRVMEGQIWVDNKQLLHLLDAFTGKSPEDVARKTGSLSLLTPREQSVVRLVVDGMGNREIAETLHLSQHTVKNYLVRIFEKLGLSSRVELVLFAIAKLEAEDAAADQLRPRSQQSELVQA